VTTTQPHVMHRRRLLMAAVTGLLFSAGCASATGSQASRAPASPSNASSARSGPFFTIATEGGTYRWVPPRVTLGAAGAAPTIVVPTTPDPVTGSTSFHLQKGAGALFTSLDRVRMRYLQQSWQGQVLHDSWHDPGHAEAIPAAGPFRDAMLGALLGGHRGDIIEVVIPASPATGGESSVVVLSLDQT
jgi:hypothetical protein